MTDAYVRDGYAVIIDEPTQSYTIETLSRGHVLRIPSLLTYEAWEFTYGELSAHIKSENGILIEDYEFDEGTLEELAQRFCEHVREHPDAFASLAKYLP